MDQPHLIEAINGVLRRPGGTARVWRTDRLGRCGGHRRRPSRRTCHPARRAPRHHPPDPADRM